VEGKGYKGRKLGSILIFTFLLFTFTLRVC
jgi:hypothetical protein